MAGVGRQVARGDAPPLGAGMQRLPEAGVECGPVVSRLTGERPPRGTAP